MTLVYAMTADGWSCMMADSASENPKTGQKYNPLLEPVVKVRLWSHNTILGFAGSTHIYNEFLVNHQSTAGIDELIQSAAQFQVRFSKSAPEFLIAKRDGSRLVRIVDGRVGERKEASIGSDDAYRRFKMHLEGRAVSDEPRLPPGLGINMVFLPVDAPPCIGMALSAFHQTLMDEVDNVCGVPMALIGREDAVSYVPVTQAWTGRDYRHADYAGGMWSVQGNDGWVGGFFLTVIPIDAFGIAYYSQFSNTGFYWNITMPSHDAADFDLSGPISGVLARKQPFGEFCQWLADVHWAEIHAWAPGSDGRMGPEGRTFSPKQRISPEIADDYRACVGVPVAGSRRVFSARVTYIQGG